MDHFFHTGLLLFSGLFSPTVSGRTGCGHDARSSGRRRSAGFSWGCLLLSLRSYAASGRTSFGFMGSAQKYYAFFYSRFHRKPAARFCARCYLGDYWTHPRWSWGGHAVCADHESSGRMVPPLRICPHDRHIDGSWWYRFAECRYPAGTDEQLDRLANVVCHGWPVHSASGGAGVVAGQRPTGG